MLRPNDSCTCSVEVSWGLAQFPIELSDKCLGIKRLKVAKIYVTPCLTSHAMLLGNGFFFQISYVNDVDMF